MKNFRYYVDKFFANIWNNRVYRRNPLLSSIRLFGLNLVEYVGSANIMTKSNAKICVGNKAPGYAVSSTLFSCPPIDIHYA